MERLSPQDKLNIIYAQRLYAARLAIRKMGLAEDPHEIVINTGGGAGASEPSCQENDTGQAKI